MWKCSLSRLEELFCLKNVMVCMVKKLSPNVNSKHCLLQIYQEAKKFGKVYNIKVVCAYGGGSMWEQVKACEECPEIIVCTPVSSTTPNSSLL